MIFRKLVFGVLPNITSRLAMLNKEYAEEIKSNLALTKALIDCFNEKDMNGLKALLCERTRELTDIDDQIVTGFDLLDGKIISFNEQSLTSYEGKSIEYGKTTHLERKWSILDIETETNENYEIYVQVYYIYEEDKRREGIAKFVVIRISDNEKLTIGYDWPDYYTEGRDKAIEIMKCFNEKNQKGLEALFCDSVLETMDIVRQIQSAMDFFEGKSIDGRRKSLTGHEYYDGSLDWGCSVNDDVAISNSEPTNILLTVHITNIKTDIGKRYEIYFYFFLLSIDYKTREGITQIVITRSDGEERIIGERISN